MVVVKWTGNVGFDIGVFFPDPFGVFRGPPLGFPELPGGVDTTNLELTTVGVTDKGFLGVEIGVREVLSLGEGEILLLFSEGEFSDPVVGTTICDGLGEEVGT